MSEEFRLKLKKDVLATVRRFAHMTDMADPLIDEIAKLREEVDRLNGKYSPKPEKSDAEKAMESFLRTKREARCAQEDESFGKKYYFRKNGFPPGFEVMVADSRVGERRTHSYDGICDGICLVPKRFGLSDRRKFPGIKNPKTERRMASTPGCEHYRRVGEKYYRVKGYEPVMAVVPGCGPILRTWFQGGAVYATRKSSGLFYSKEVVIYKAVDGKWQFVGVE